MWLLKAKHSNGSIQYIAVESEVLKGQYVILKYMTVNSDGT